ncbi:MAG TPA: L,D-transpeptidase family protein [Candidatus Edwardsbacteria bacterium]|nr:L,D-transpeptidase family protein [Candidatus Edwardsbacteria bacterium]
MNYKKGGLALIVASMLCAASLSAATFKQQQLRYVHVQAAYRDKETAVKALFAKKGILFPPQRALVRVLKREQQVELWAAAKAGDEMTLIASYDICASSGGLGPKRQRGDGQVPEGFYHINHFNPESSFYLSLGVSYPNAADKIRAGAQDPGGAIYIHGNCVTIGCMPITDDKIKELYVALLETSANGGREIPVMIFPAKLDSAGCAALQREYKGQTDLLAFWSNLRQGYELFERYHTPPKVSNDRKGVYAFAR